MSLRFFLEGKMHDEATKMVLGTKKKVSLEEPHFIWKSIAMRTNYMVERGSTVWVAESPCFLIARLLAIRTLSCSLLTEIYFSCIYISWCYK